MGIKRNHIFISGRVQGVSFRMAAWEKAQKRNIKGWVHNLADGRVEIVAEGEETDLARFTDWCSEGPRFANITKIEVTTTDATNELDDFQIR